LTAKSKTIFFCTMLLISAFSLPAITLVQSQSNLFSITLIVPGPNPSRKAWAAVVESAFVSAGINAKRVELDWDTVYSRALTPDSATVGKTYDEGGFDALFVGYAMGIDPDPFPLYDSSQFPPLGQNYNLWNNSESDRLCQLIKVTTDEATRLQYVKQWEKLAFDEQPAATLLYTKEPVAFDPTALKGDPFTLFHYPAWPRMKNWELATGTTQTSIVLAQTGPAPEESLNPLLTTSYYDLTVYDCVFDLLAERENLNTKAMKPALATSWEVATDQKSWTVHLRDGVKWHDGVAFTADDVKFTFDSNMNDAIGSPTGAFVKDILGGPDNVVVVDSLTVKFNLPKPYAYFVETILGGEYVIPKHVLEGVAPADWKTNTYSTASGSYTVGSYTAHGPIGTGPYVYDSYNPTTLSNKMTKNNNYWGKATLEAAGKFGIQTFYVQQIEDSAPAIAALKSGDVDVLDSQYSLSKQLPSIEKPWGDYISYDAFGVQELGFNMKHPVFGTGVDTPLGKQDPSRAAEAARYVRQAMSHLINRQNIIDSILAGYGSLGVTTPITRVTAGFDTSLTPYSYDVTLAKSLLAAAGYNTGVAPPAADIWGQYGLYIIAVVVVVIILVVGAVVWRARAKKTTTQT
jgi:ABC-type transport system substrate-binding protein